jgi:hypothetical protein
LNRHPLPVIVAVSLLVCPSLAARAAAQSGDRIVVAVSGGVQGGAPRLTDHFEFERNVETATVDVKYPTKPAVLVDGSVTARIWKRLAVGAAVSQATRSGAAQVDARIPHPLLFQQPRTLSGTQSGVDTAETGIHLQIACAIRVTRRITVTPSGGPSYVRVGQELVTDVKYDETYPYDTATFTSAPTRRATAAALGFNAGADVRWMFTRSAGLGGLVRFTRANVDLTSGSRTVPVQAGGIQAAAGLRFVF